MADILKQFELDWEGVLSVKIDQQLIERAASVARAHGLRSLACIQLASCLEVRAALALQAVMVSVDMDLLKAARAERLNTSPLS